MHKYLRAIGFSDPPRRRDFVRLIEEGIKTAVYKAYTTNDSEDDSLLAQFNVETGKGFGISVCGQFDDGDVFFPEYYYPYLESGYISTSEELSIEKRLDNESYAGYCDDMKVGITLIFRLQNPVEYVKHTHISFAPTEGTSVSLTALSLEGTVMLPMYISDEDLRRRKLKDVKRQRLMTAARNGSDDAAKELTLSDMEAYSNVMSHLPYDDIYTLVDSYFMPYGAECELYSVLGNIHSCETRRNKLTNEEIYIITVDCNDLTFDIAINKRDLFGEPAPGRRFKGIIWLQGKVNFPDDVLSIENDPEISRKRK